MCKYVAKLRLLEYGLLDAALGLDSIHIHAIGNNDGDEDEDSRDETVEQFEERVELFVRIHISRASSSKRDHYKDAIVYQTRKDVISEFLKAAISKKCQNEGCGA